MIEFKRTASSLVTNLIAALGGGMLLLFLCSIFWEPNPVTFGVSAVAVVLAAYYLIHSEDVRLVIEDEELVYYQNGKLADRFVIPDCVFHSRYNSSGVLTPRMVRLFVRYADAEREESCIDCSALGTEQCERLFALLSQQAREYTEEVDPRTHRKWQRDERR